MHVVIKYVEKKKIKTVLTELFAFHLCRISTGVKNRIIIQLNNQVTNLFMNWMKCSTNIV